MAPETGSNEAGESPSPVAATEANIGKSSAWWRVLAAMASPTLTVFLILTAIGIVMVGTLAQVQMDLWEVIERYFRDWVCWVELKVLFPASFFPWAAQTDWDSLRIHVLPFPGGALIGLALVINLATAHAVRFQVKARDARLKWGLLVLAVGIAATWLVIEAGHNRHGLQGKPLLDWPMLWLLIRTGLVVLWLACVVGLVQTVRSGNRQRPVALGILGACALGLGLLLVWIFVKGEAAVLTDSSLRILYQLIQGQVAALVLLAACVLLFGDRAGGVLLHGGVALLMFGEFFVSYFAEEQQLTLAEGQTVSYMQDTRSIELVASSLFHADHNDVVAVPVEANGKATRFALGRVVPLDDLPFDMEVVRYHKNSTLKAATPHGSNLATKGVGTRFVAEEAPPTSGVQRGQVDLASAYVKVRGKKQGEELGTYLVSQHLSALPATLNTVSPGGGSYGLELRFKRSYKPYQVTLLEVRRDDYVGTAMARNYSSQVRLTDPLRNVDFKTKIWMNNPLRYAGETFYQSGYNVDRQGRKTSTLQVVKNTGWMIPYVSCMIVSTGMLTHFLLLLLRFLRRAQNGADEDAAWVAKRLPAQISPHRRSTRLVPVVVVLLATGWVASRAVPPHAPGSQMKLEEFGALPLMYEGRIKPFDTLARNSLRILSNRETFVDDNGNRQPAIRWLLDVIARPDAAEKHRVFRIDSSEVQETLGLERRQGACYAWEEFRPQSSQFQKLATLPQQQAAPQRTLQQRKVMDLVQRVDRYRLLADAFLPLPFPPTPAQSDLAGSSEEASARAATADRLAKDVPRRNGALQAMPLPLAVPAGPARQPWLAYAAARNEAYASQLLHTREPAPATMKLAAIFEAYRRDDAQAFNQAVADYEELLADESPAGLNSQITRLEAYFNHFAPFYQAIPLYVLALVLTAFAWLAAVVSPRWSRLARSSAFWLIVMTFAVHTFALVARVVISGRPPVTNLYSSAVFIGWGCVAIGLLMETVFRLGIGNFVSAATGIGTLVIAHFLAGDGDTIRVLQAVLDTQFWLTVHVLTITLGYSAMFLAGMLGLASVGYALGKAAVFVADYLRGRRLPSDWLAPSCPSPTERIVGSMIYGSICFAAFFSLVGTVLGGLWADDSWGRFWGWDPKENGALIIVLWTALVLHARSAKLVKQRGMAVLAVGGNIVTSWSWFGVNQLGVGLHSYGSATGVTGMLLLFWISQLVAMGLIILPVLTARIVRRPTSLEAEAA
jgi:cytochrome c-type biogenesis protein CcsB